MEGKGREGKGSEGKGKRERGDGKGEEEGRIKENKKGKEE